MSATAEINQTVKDFILREFLPGEDPNDLTNTTPMVSGGILDSLATVKLIAFLEKQFGIEFEPHELSGEYLETLDTIAEVVQSKKAK
jgi:acyl carrier protein